MPKGPGRPPAGKAKVQAYLPPELYARIQALAKREYRSISDQMWFMLDIALEVLEKEPGRKPKDRGGP